MRTRKPGSATGQQRWRSSRRQLVVAAGAVAITGQVVVAREAATPVGLATPVPDTQDGWPFYGHDPQGTKATVASDLSSETVGTLAPLWEVQVGGAVSATPVIAGGVVYIGSYDGSLDAIDLHTGEVRWSYETGAAVQEPNLQIPLGITGSAAMAADVVYIGDAAATVHAIDVESGEARWSTLVDDQPEASIWSSPVVMDHVVYVGVASIAKEVGFRGSVVALDAVSGDLLWQTFMVPEGADGAGVFSVPAVDEERGVLYVGTQNAYTENPAPYGNPVSIVALDMRSGDVVWVFHAPEDTGTTAPTDDVAFSASPNLFSLDIDGVQRDLLGQGQKSGQYWVLDRETGEVVWQATVSPAGFLGGMEGTSAVRDGVIAVPATDWPEFDGPATGMVTALDAASGDVLWSAAQDAPAASPVAIANDLVFHAGMDGILHAYILTTGEEVWRSDLEASVSGGVAIAGDVLVVGAATPQIAPFVQVGDAIRAFGLKGEGATPESAMPVS